MDPANVGTLVQAGALGLCMVLIGILFWVLKHLLTKLIGDLVEILSKDIAHLQRSIDTLPCRSGPCPGPEKEES